MMLLKLLLINTNKQVHTTLHAEFMLRTLLKIAACCSQYRFVRMVVYLSLALEDLLHAHFVMRSVVLLLSAMRDQDYHLAPKTLQASFLQASFLLCACMNEAACSEIIGATYLLVSVINSIYLPIASLPRPLPTQNQNSKQCCLSKEVERLMIDHVNDELP